MSAVAESIEALKRYRDAEGTLDIAESADYLASALEDMMRVASMRDVEVADMVDEYFQENEAK